MASRESDTNAFATNSFLKVEPSNIWEKLALSIINVEDNDDMKAYVQAVTILRVAIPSLAAGAFASALYPSASLALANWIDDAGVFAVVSQDASQYIQNVLTTSGLVFSILVGQTFCKIYLIVVINHQ